MKLPASAVVEVHQSGIQRLFVHDCCHVVVDYAADFLAGDGSLIRKSVGNPDGVDVSFSELILEYTVDALHSFALELVVHDDHIAVEAFHVIKQ